MKETSVKSGLLAIVLVFALAALTQSFVAGASLFAPGTEQGSRWTRYGLSGTDFQAVDGATPDSVWAVGTDGVLARWAGGAWSAYDNTKIGPLSFNGVDVVSSGAAWAVADRQVARWDGTSWQGEPVSVSASATMLDISMASATDGWIVGGANLDSPVIARYNGSSWQQVSAPAVTRPLRGVDAVDANNAWAVGGRFGQPPMGEIVRWDGVSWSHALTLTQVVLNDIDMLDAGYGWAVGSSSALWKWEGGSWTQAAPPTQGATLLSVTVLSRTEAWATGSNFDTWRWDGISWTAVPNPGGIAPVGIVMLSDGTGWAVGARATIWRWDGGAWSVETTRQTTNGYWAVDFVSRNDGWAVGAFSSSPPTYGLQHWNGSAWEVYQSSFFPNILVDVDMVSSDAAWAVGTDGEIYRWDGNAWTLQANLPTGLNTISMVSATEGWAGGGNTSQAALAHYVGGQWVDYPISAANNIEAIDMVDANEGWAGGIGMLFNYKNGTWSRVSSSMSVYGIYMVDANEGWAVGGEGAIWHYQNGTWTQQASPTSAILQSVHMINAEEGWAVGVMPGLGAPPVLLHYSDGNWNLVPQPSGRALGDVFAFDSDEAWAVGTSPGVLLRYGGEPTPTATPVQATSTRTAQPTGTATAVASATGTASPTNIAPATATRTPSLTPCSESFSDVQPSDYFYGPVAFLYCRGVISGYGDGTFRPYSNTTRGQVAKIVVLAFGYPLYVPPTAPSFTDVPADHPFYSYVETAAYNGIVSGYSDGTYSPYNNVTRGQLSKVVVEAARWPLAEPQSPTFSDVPAGHSFYAYIETAYEHAILSGYSDGTFRAGNDATRGQISKIVYNAVVGP